MAKSKKNRSTKSKKNSKSKNTDGYGRIGARATEYLCSTCNCYIVTTLSKFPDHTNNCRGEPVAKDGGPLAATATKHGGSKSKKGKNGGSKSKKGKNGGSKSKKGKKAN